MGFFILIGILLLTYIMVISKRIHSVISIFRWQSLFLFIATFMAALREVHVDLFIVAFFLLILKVIIIPDFLFKTIKQVKTKEDVGLIINPQFSLFFALLATYMSWLFALQITPDFNTVTRVIVAISFSIILMGMFLMVARLKALVQIIGLLVMENGLFLLASSVSGGMPFFVEIAIFFDVFISVIILGVFVYRINKLFTHIDVDKLSDLKG